MKKGWPFEMIIFFKLCSQCLLILFKILMCRASAARTLQRKENYFMVCNSVEESYNLRDTIIRAIIAAKYVCHNSKRTDCKILMIVVAKKKYICVATVHQ